MTLTEALAVWDRQEALKLLSFVTGYSSSEILLHGERELTEAALYENLIKKRKNNVPLQYLLGRWEFMGLEFITDDRALIPRPDTEILTEAVLKKGSEAGVPLIKILDVCTGGGCIAVSLAALTNADITAADICPHALALARENAALHHVSDRIRFIQCDLFTGLQGEIFDVIVSNPPYIPTGEIAALQPEVRDYEPRLALDGGADGLDIYRRLIPAAIHHLCPGGALFLEIGPRDGVAGLMTLAGFTDIITLKDYAGLNRVVHGTAPGRRHRRKSEGV
jgi:release factor glutamine methyltransferase